MSEPDDIEITELAPADVFDTPGFWPVEVKSKGEIKDDYPDPEPGILLEGAILRAWARLFHEAP
jgi:hypothetical protein